MSRSDLQSMFEPRGVVVVGASSDPGKLGHAMATSLGTFRGSVALVNSRPSPGMHLSIGEAVAASDSPIDLAIMCIPAGATAHALRESAAVGVRSALVCAGGFAEIGGQGLIHAADVDEAVRETGMSLLGPNTSGFFVPATSLYASFVPGARGVETGSVAVVAASGGMNHVLAFQLAESGLGVSVGVGVGAGRDVEAADILRYLADHEQTRAIILHIETVADGRALVEAIERVLMSKPVVALVIGRNDVSGFAESHTGALATSWRTTRAALRQAGAVVVDDEEQAIAAVAALSRRRAQPSRAVGVALVTGQAGPGLIVADALASAGVTVPTLQDSTRDALAGLLPPLTYQENPVDTGRPGATFPAVLTTVADDSSIDVLGVYAITEPVVDLPAAVASAAIDPAMPIVLAVDGPAIDIQHARRSAELAGIALVRGPTRLAQALAALADDARMQAERAEIGGDDGFRLPALDWSGAWDEVRGKELLDALGIPTPPRRRCADRAAAHAAFAELGGPVAVKLVDAAVVHKTDIGGVVLGVDSTAALGAALDTLERAGASEFLVERMAPAGVDLVLGARVDPVFGPIVLVGLGGTTAEAVGDVSIRMVPISAVAASRMIDDLAAGEVLNAFRGGPTIDRAELGRAISTIGSLVASGALQEIEINPLRSTVDGIVALDAVVHSFPHGERELNR